MAYNYPAIGGLSFAFKAEVGNGMGWIFTLTDTSENAIWFYGPKADTDMIAEITAAGGILTWLKTKFAAINAALVAHFAPAAPPTTAAVTVDNINLTIASGLVFTAGLSAPILAAK